MIDGYSVSAYCFQAQVFSKNSPDEAGVVLLNVFSYLYFFGLLFAARA